MKEQLKNTKKVNNAIIRFNLFVKSKEDTNGCVNCKKNLNDKEIIFD